MSEHEMKHIIEEASFERGLKSQLLTPIMENSPRKGNDIAGFLSTRLSPDDMEGRTDSHVEYGRA